MVKIRERNNVIVDLDHTLFNSFWRDPMIGTTTWDEYHAAGKDDKPLDDMVEMIRALSLAGYNNIGCTARPGKWRKQSMEQCVLHDIPLHELLMRPDDNYRASNEMKLELVRARFGEAPHEHIAFVLDDREDVVAAFKAIGITALQVHGRRE